MLIIDGHEDLAWVSLVLKRDLTLAVKELKASDRERSPRGGGATTSLPQLREGGVRVVFATIYATPYRDDTDEHRRGYRTPKEAFAQAETQIAYYHRLETAGEATIIRSSDDLDDVVTGNAPTPGLVLLIEGADPLRSPDDLEWFVERGVRVIGLAWSRTRYSGGDHDPGPLTPLGRELLTRMANANVALDISHMAEEAFWQALDEFDGEVIASHSNCRSIVPGERQLSDQMISAVAERGGVIGMVLYNGFIRAGWRYGDSRSLVALTDLVPHIDHIAELVGAEHIGLGTDLDGGGGLEATPMGIESAADLVRLAQVLRNAGYSETETAGIMGENWLRVLRTILQ